MAKHLVKCLYCGQVFDAESEPYVKPRQNRYAHLACAEAAAQEKSEDEKQQEDLEQYILQLLQLDNISLKIKKQIDTYIHDYHYTYEGIKQSLKYFYEIKKNDISKAQEAIGIVPFIYRESLQYFMTLQEIQQKNKDVKIELPVREVHIEPPKREPINKLRSLFSFLDEGE